MDQQEQSFKMGKRLKELRESKGLSHEKLKKIMMEEYHIKISRDSLMSYEISDEFHSKAEKCPNLKMRVEYLNCFSDLYGVSTDYLLGKTDIKNPDISVREICEYTGLSEESIPILHAWNNPFGVPKLLDSIIGNRYADPLFETLVDLLNAVSCQEYEMEMHYKRSTSGADLDRIKDQFDKFCKIEEQLNKELDDHFEIIGISDRIDLLRSRITRLWEGIVDEIIAEERGND